MKSLTVVETAFCKYENRRITVLCNGGQKAADKAKSLLGNGAFDTCANKSEQFCFDCCEEDCDSEQSEALEEFENPEETDLEFFQGWESYGFHELVQTTKFNRSEHEFLGGMPIFGIPLKRKTQALVSKNFANNK